MFWQEAKKPRGLRFYLVKICFAYRMTSPQQFETMKIRKFAEGTRIFPLMIRTVSILNETKTSKIEQLIVMRQMLSEE